MRNYQIKTFFALWLFFISLNSISLQAQSGGNIEDCKKWFFSITKELPKNKHTFAKKHFKIPFLEGLSSDAHFTYNRISSPKQLVYSVKTFFTDCSKDLKNTSAIQFKEVSANEQTLENLLLSYAYTEVDDNEKKVNPNEPVSYLGLVNNGDQVFVITTPCGPVYEIYDLPLSVTYYAVFDKTSKAYKFWASVIGF
ncbi:MAG: hypothetical protein JNL36_06675 [Candidatus Kapabacteria bacterium]|nr:hypothetical protein [Candidatus Kapabacteria bacterium]